MSEQPFSETGRLTRIDCEAILWDYLAKALPAGVAEMIDALGIAPGHWDKLDHGERVAMRAAVDVVRARTSRHVWEGSA